MFVALLGIHLLVCLGLIGVILIQSGKGGGLTGGAFGGATQTVFGGRGAVDFITRATIGLGVAFFITSLSLALMTASGQQGSGKSLLQQEARRLQQQSAGSRAPGGAAQPSAPVPGGGGAPAPAKR